MVGSRMNKRELIKRIIKQLRECPLEEIKYFMLYCMDENRSFSVDNLETNSKRIFTLDVLAHHLKNEYLSKKD